MSRRPRKTPSSAAPNPALKPSTDALGVGDHQTPLAPAAPPRPVRARVPFGSYLDPQLQREFKARCVLLGIEMQEGLEEAIVRWLEENPG